MKRKKKVISFFSLLLIAIGAIYMKDIEEIFKENSPVQNREVEQTINLDNQSTVKVYFLDVGQADSILLENQGKYMLIDAGNNEDGPLLVNYFKSLNIETFDFVIGTHAHEDHIGGMDDIIENFAITTFYMPDAITTTKTFEDVLDALDDRSVAFQTPEIDGTFSFGDCKFQVLYVGDDASDLNDTSIVLRMLYGNHSFLFMGDATSKVEEKIIKKDLSSEVLKVGHHGSQYSTTSQFLEQVKPQYVIISVGKNNSYDHPKEATLNRIKNSGAKIYRTDEMGTIVAIMDRTTLTFDMIQTNTNG